MPLDISRVPTPCYVLEEEKLRANLAILDRVQREEKGREQHARSGRGRRSSEWANSAETL